jgi:hypothetical protein
MDWVQRNKDWNEAETKRLTERAAAIARLEQYTKERGLADTPENAALIQQFLDENAKGRWSPRNVDAAVQVLRQQLQWKVPEPPAPAATTPKRVWKRGDTGPLPDDATEQMLRDATLAQVKEWRDRQLAR